MVNKIIADASNKTVQVVELEGNELTSYNNRLSDASGNALSSLVKTKKIKLNEELKRREALVYGTDDKDALMSSVIKKLCDYDKSKELDSNHVMSQADKDFISGINVKYVAIQSLKSKKDLISQAIDSKNYNDLKSYDVTDDLNWS